MEYFAGLFGENNYLLRNPLVLGSSRSAQNYEVSRHNKRSVEYILIACKSCFNKNISVNED